MYFVCPMVIVVDWVICFHTDNNMYIFFHLLESNLEHSMLYVWIFRISMSHFPFINLISLLLSVLPCQFSVRILLYCHSVQSVPESPLIAFQIVNSTFIKRTTMIIMMSLWVPHISILPLSFRYFRFCVVFRFRLAWMGMAQNKRAVCLINDIEIDIKITIHFVYKKGYKQHVNNCLFVKIHE